MIIPFSVRETHPRDRTIITWYKQLPKSERSREIREILLSHIHGTKHTISHEIGDSLQVVPKNKEVKIEMVDLTGGGDEVDLDSKLDSFGGGF